MSGSSSVFDASASVIGYLYQLRYALWVGLEEFNNDANWSVSVETVDDVETSTVGESRRWQLKHRAGGTTMTNGSTDLWKTLRIWSKGVAEGSLDPARTRLILLTTASVPVGSAAHFLQAGTARDVTKAAGLLAKAATSSKSDVNKKGIEAYLALDLDRQRRPMLDAITVVVTGSRL